MSENKTENEILKLIRLVDQNFKFTTFDLFFRRGNAYVTIPLIIFLVIIEIYLQIASLYERIVVGLAFLSFVIPLFSLIIRFGETNVVEVNVKRLSICVEKNEYPLLKALIKMKVKHEEISLEQTYRMNDSMFTREKLLEKLYE